MRNLYFCFYYAVFKFLDCWPYISTSYTMVHGERFSVFRVSRHSDSPRAGRSGDQIPVGARFSSPVHSPGAHPASYTVGTGSFSRLKQPGCGVDHPAPASAEVKERVELYLYSTSGPSWPVLGWPLPLPLPLEQITDSKILTTCDLHFEEIFCLSLQFTRLRDVITQPS
jgi:hypothetical protein